MARRKTQTPPAAESGSTSPASNPERDPSAAEEPSPGKQIHIRKYPNRRMYDTSRSTHITMDQLYDLVADGRQVQVVDSRTGQDITNQTLATALIERDPDKLRLFPTWMLHYMVSSREQVLVRFFNQYWSLLINAFLAAQPGTTGAVPAPPPQSPGAKPTTAGFPFDLSAFGTPPNMPGIGKPVDPSAMFNPMTWMNAFAGGAGDASSDSDDDKTDARSPSVESPGTPDEITELQREVAELAKRLAELTSGKSKKSR